jgi:hypothetical protein
MGIEPPKSPNPFRPEKPDISDSWDSKAREYEEQRQEVNQLLEEEADKAFQHLAAKLPRDVLEQLDVSGGLKEKLYDYFNRNYRNMLNRYMAAAEDEMVKKIRTYIDKEEMKVRSRYTSREITDLLEQAGGAGKFNTDEIERSVANMYGHLQGHIQQGVSELENQTSRLLRQKTDVGAFIRGENTYSIVKCAFKDNPAKPKTVRDVKLSVNIPDSELISPIFHYQVTAEYLIKDILSKYIIDTIDKEIEKLKDERIDLGLEELSGSEIIFAKLGKVEDYTDDKAEDPQSRRYSIIAKSLFDRLADIRAEINPENFDPQNIRENLKKILDMENIRSRGFNTAVNSITSILDAARMGYQYIENLKNARELLIREYEDTDTAHLPDERYQIRMRYYDNAQLVEERKAYDMQIKSFEAEVRRLWDVLNAANEGANFFFKAAGYAGLTKRNRNRIRKIKAKSGGALYEDMDKVWDEISFIQAAETEVERMNRTCVYEKDKIRRMILMMRDKLKSMYDYQRPKERRIMEDRLNFLEGEYRRFESLINPYHIQPGLLLDVDITSIKRRKTTLDAMTNVLNEFIHSVSKGFQDAAFASFSRRQSPAWEDAGRSFSAGGDEALPPDDEALFRAGFDTPNSDDSAEHGDSIPVPDEPAAKPESRISGGLDSDAIAEV